MRVLVVGSEGWIGSAVRKHLSGIDGNSVIGYDLVFGQDLCDVGFLRRMIVAFAPDAIINCAGEIREAASVNDPLKYWRNNTWAAACLFEVARRHNVKVVHLSTVAVDSAEATPYGGSKAAAELAARLAVRQGAQIVQLRLHNVYGPGQPEDFVVPKFLRAAAEGTTIYYGRNARDYVYLGDIVEIVERAISLPPRMMPYEVGTGHAISDLEVAATAIRVVGSVSRLVALEGGTATLRSARPVKETWAKTSLEEGMTKVWQTMSSALPA